MFKRVKPKVHQIRVLTTAMSIFHDNFRTVSCKLSLVGVTVFALTQYFGGVLRSRSHICETYTCRSGLGKQGCNCTNQILLILIYDRIMNPFSNEVSFPQCSNPQYRYSTSPKTHSKHKICMYVYITLLSYQVSCKQWEERAQAARKLCPHNLFLLEIAVTSSDASANIKKNTRMNWYRK